MLSRRCFIGASQQSAELAGEADFLVGRLEACPRADSDSAHSTHDDRMVHHIREHRALACGREYVHDQYGSTSVRGTGEGKEICNVDRWISDRPGPIYMV